MSTARSASVLSAMSRDVAVKVISTCGRFRLSAVHALGVYRETLKRHGLAARSREDVSLLSLVSDNIVFSNLLASQLNQEERVVSTFTTPDATCYAESLALGECRAYVANHSQSGVVHGALRVDRVLYNHAKPVSSVTVLDDETLIASTDSSPEDRRALMHSSLTPHVFNFYSKSEGVPVAVLLASSLPSAHGDQGAATWMTAEYSAGAVLQPIVDDSAEASLQSMQQHLFGLLLPSASSPGSASHSVPLERLVRRSVEKKCVVQDLLGLFSGDFSGAYEVAKRCRLPTVSITESAQVIEPLRLRLPGAPTVALDAESATRTPLDYFCRCSKADFVAALRLCTQVQVDEAKAAGAPSCRYCKRSFELSDEEWQAARVAARST